MNGFDVRYKQLEARVAALERLLDKVSLPGVVYLTDGSRPITGALDHRGGTLGVFGVTPAPRAAAYTVTNLTSDRVYNADTVLVAELADVVGTLLVDLRTYGLVR